MAYEINNEWQQMLEYAFPHTLTDEEKQIIQNNVELILKQQTEKIEKILADSIKDKEIYNIDTCVAINKLYLKIDKII